MTPTIDRQGRLIASAEYSIEPHLLYRFQDGTRNTLPPLKLETSEGVTLRLAFHSESTDAYGDIKFYIEDLVTNGLSVEVDVIVKKVLREGGSYVDADRSLWSAPESIARTLTENGLVGKVTPYYTTFVTVQVKVYSLTPPALPLFPPILKGLNEARVQGHLPDVVLSLGDDEFPAHRAVLAATSPVFLKMFSGDFKEAKALKKRESGDLVCEVALSGVSKEAVELFLTLMYQGWADDWMGLEVELLEISDYYMVSHIKETCETRLMGMDGSTALGILRQADNPVISSEVRVRAVQAVLQGWKQLSMTPLWRDLQKACPVLADAIRAAQQLYEPAAKPSQ